jgi:hypothetical protein
VTFISLDEDTCDELAAWTTTFWGWRILVQQRGRRFYAAVLDTLLSPPIGGGSRAASVSSSIEAQPM